MSSRFVLAIPGEPVPQARPRAFYLRGQGIRFHDTDECIAWKRAAAATMRVALQRAGVRAPLYAEGPLELHVLAVFTCPSSHHRKREPLPRRPHASVPDADNLAKAVQDAGKGLLWTDDGQVVRLVAEKIIGAQGEPPRVLLMVRPLPVDVWAQLRRLATLEADVQAELDGADDAGAELPRES